MNDKTIDMTELPSNAKDFKQKKEEFETSFNAEVNQTDLYALLDELSRYGEVELTFDSNGWFCKVVLLPMIKNVNFNVKSEQNYPIKNKTAYDAVLQCRTRVKESIERLKGI